jgi:flavin reductase (DIM6/NTAB) family NADH-FMN oxidoreductase RutF
MPARLKDRKIMFYEPSKGHGLPHDPFKAIVAPRPIGWISTVSAAGALNLAPYSFFNALGANPHLVMFSSEGEKDSVVFARETGEFVANLASGDLAQQRVQRRRAARRLRVRLCRADAGAVGRGPATAGRRGPCRARM